MSCYRYYKKKLHNSYCHRNEFTNYAVKMCDSSVCPTTKKELDLFPDFDQLNREDQRLTRADVGGGHLAIGKVVW